MNYRKFKHNFGVEIEGFTALARTRFIRNVVEQTGLVFGYEAWKRESNAEDFWILTTDGSVKSPFDKKGEEIVSPILKGEQGIKDLQKMLKAIRNKKAFDKAKDTFRTNKSCSIHVHINTGNYTEDEIKKIFYMYQHLEHELNKMFPKSRRANTSRGGESYCAPIVGYTYEELLNVGDKKYHSVNFPDDITTIEFRIHGGSTNPKKIVNWLRILDYIIKFALDSQCVLNWEDSVKMPELCDVLPASLLEYYQERVVKFHT